MQTQAVINQSEEIVSPRIMAIPPKDAAPIIPMQIHAKIFNKSFFILFGCNFGGMIKKSVLN